MPTKITFTSKPVPATTISRLSGTTKIKHKQSSRPSVNGAVRETQPFMGACARPNLRIVIAEAQAHSPATMAHSRPWEFPTAIRICVNRRDSSPAPTRGCGVITHQSQFYK